MKTSGPIMTSPRSPWILNKILAVFLAGTYLGLTGDLRYEHVDKVRHDWTAWIPIAYSSVMTVVCLLSLLLWDRQGRQALFCASALGLVVGLLGFWLHNQGHLFRDLALVLDAWIRSEHHANTPPTLAPLAFCGLGGLGMLACAARFQPLGLGQYNDGPGK
jgi:hypothetical protein